MSGGNHKGALLRSEGRARTIHSYLNLGPAEAEATVRGIGGSFSKLKVIGVTGGLCTGKTTVARFFAELGAEVLDADEIAHQVMRPDEKPWEEIVDAFGEDVLDNDRTINRKRLAKIVFESREALERLEGIVHPAVIGEIQKSLIQIKAKKSASFVVIDAPLLIEAGLDKIVDELVVVKVSQGKQIERTVSFGRITRDQAMKRIAYQLPLTKKIEKADYVIDNSGSLDQTRRQVERIWRKIWISIS